MNFQTVMTDFEDCCFIVKIFDKFSWSDILRECLSHLNEAYSATTE